MVKELGISATDKPNSVRLIIVDDHRFMRDLMARTLARHIHYSVVATVGTAAEAITACRELSPDVLILDINLPDQNGIDALPELRRVAPTTRVLLCTGFPTDDRIADLANTGAHGFVEKTSTWEEFLQAVQRVSRGEYYFCSRSAAMTPAFESEQKGRMTADVPTLTAREREIITLVAQGLTSKEIAARLYISVATVETHRTNLMTKLGVRNVAELMSHAFQSGLVKVRSNTAPPKAHKC
jgi:DNA-binding NarL/FixJ family response regulator